MKTLNLKHQAAAQKVMDRYIPEANRRYQLEHSTRSNVAFSTYIPMTELISLMFNLPAIKVSEQRSEVIANAAYINRINPVLDVVSMMTGIDTLKVGVINRANATAKKERKY